MASATTQVKILVPGNQPMVALLGQRDVFLKLIESAFDCRILVRGNEITVTGREQEAERVARIFEELLIAARAGPRAHRLVGRPDDRARQGRRVDAGGGRCARARCSATGSSPRAARASPRRRSARSGSSTRSGRNTVTFAIGPAGTGKTYLAVATAVKALQDHQVSRLILTRPAVEAGERLGYLPGTLYEKIDPYMRPLYDALFEMTGRRHASSADGTRHGRGRAARLHAGTNAE